MNIHLLCYYIGIVIVSATHILMFVKPPIGGILIGIHATINIIAVGLIAYYFMNKEGYINF